MPARVQAWATAAWLALACGGGLGFVARDLLDAGPPAVTLAWIAGAGLGVLLGGCGASPPRAPRGEGRR